jgi:two-component system chemotaxis response regulator CheY
MARIFIVDDSKSLKEYVKDYLSQWGHEFAGEAMDCFKTVEEYSSCRPDLVILDMNIPEQDGLKTLSKILEMDRKAKVIIITEIGTEEMVFTALHKGAKSFLVKPFTMSDLREKIEKVLGARRIRKKLFALI